MRVGALEMPVQPAPVEEPPTHHRRVRALVYGAWLLVLASVIGQLAGTSSTLGAGDVADVVLISITFTVVGGAIAARVPDNRFGWVVLAIGTTGAVAACAASLPEPGFARWLGYWLWWPAYGLIPIALLLFPTGRLPSPRWRWVAVATCAAVACGALALAIARALDPDPVNFDGPVTDGGDVVTALVLVIRLSIALTGIGLLAAVASLVVRMRTAGPLERRQILCLSIGGLALLLGIVLAVFSVTDAWIAGVVAVPVAAGVAILWHRLYDLDLVINRTLVYAGVSAALLVAYVAIVWIGNGLIGDDDMPAAPALIAAAVVAIGINPLRGRLQRSVDRLFYGRRDDPYAVMSAVSRGHQSPESAEATLSHVVETVARNLALPYAAIELTSDASLRCEWGRRAGALITVPLNYAGERIGSLLITARTVGGTLTPAEQQLLEDLSYQVAVTAHAVELSLGLQRSREHLVAAREEERRRLRRDLHDGLGPALAAITMSVEAARNLMQRSDAAAVDRVLVSARDQSQEAIADIRRLVYGLRPPSLDELGLVGAIRDGTEHFGSAGVEVYVRAPDELPALPAAVEVAALRIVQEAVANVAAHSGARSCTISVLVGDAAVELDVCDDGRGIALDARRGVGLRSMVERAVEVGGLCVIEPGVDGGTRVHARLPLPAQDKVGTAAP